jgi:competence protein ComEC
MDSLMGDHAADTSICECWFLDVGQGASNVILLGDRRAVVIDCGPKGSVQTLHLLRTLVDYIEALIITHNDEDHDGSVASVLKAYPKAIKRILFLQDRPANEIRTYNEVALLRSTLKDDYPPPERLEAGSARPRIVLAEGDIELTVAYPDFTANLDAEHSGSRRANRSSAVLRLTCGNRSVVFAGDATCEAWEAISSELPVPGPLKCDIITVPHHGGTISTNPATEAQTQEKLYRDIINASYGIVSVGTSNTHGHPRPETLSALARTGVRVLCTQITDKCCDDLESVRPLRRWLIHPTRSTKETVTTSGGNSRNVACYGTIVAEVSSAAIKFVHMPLYTRDMKAYASVKGFRPLCMACN